MGPLITPLFRGPWGAWLDGQGPRITRPPAWPRMVVDAMALDLRPRPLHALDMAWAGPPAQVEAMLGPKTEEDLKPVEKKKAKPAKVGGGHA